MTKSLLLLRHAKSSWSDPLLPDFDRPLSARGRKAAPRMAAYMKEHTLTPSLALCSAACRAKETWDLVRPTLQGGNETKTLRSLYLASPSRLLAALQRVPDTVDQVVLIGHNPGIQNLAIKLSGPGSESEALASMCGKYPTAALAEILFDVDAWSGLAERAGRLVRFVCPRDL